MIKLSILIPSYNHSKFIEETLDSHVENNPFDYEIIIIDDGSTDNSVEVIQKWVDKHPLVKTKFIHRENRGVTATLNQLIGLAQGEFIRMFGSDDISYPESNQQMVAFMESNLLDGCFGFCKVINEQGVQIQGNSIEDLDQKMEAYEKDVKLAVISKWAIVGPSLMVTKKALQKVGKFDESSLIEDWYLYMHLVAKTNTTFMKSCVAYYRHHAMNASRTKDRSKKIRNYDSQIKSGVNCLSLFQGYYRVKLMQEILTLRLKKIYTIVFKK